jgi:ssRNA-specific RNase YbeY (16S rRNA maturation enzyme)
MKVNICGIPYEVLECKDSFSADATHFGEIDYKACKIRINKDMATEAKEETICHEMIHGILVHLGYSEQSQDETFVQALANAIYQGFEIKEWRSKDE